MNEPMTEEELQTIRHWLKRYQDLRYGEEYKRDDRETQYAIIETYFDDVPALLAEVERLRLVADAAEDELAFQRAINQQIGKENAGMREIVQAVAAADPVSDAAREWSGVPGWLSVAIDRVWVAKARAILAEQPNETPGNRE